MVMEKAVKETAMFQTSAIGKEKTIVSPIAEIMIIKHTLLSEIKAVEATLVAGASLEVDTIVIKEAEWKCRD